MAAAEIVEEPKAPKSLKSACQGAACKTSSLADETKLEKDSASSTSSEQNPESFSVLSGPDVVSSSAMSLGYPLNESSKDEQNLPSRDMEVLEYSGSSSSGSVDEMKKELDDCCTESNKESDSFGATMSLDKMQLESVFDDFDICLDGDGSLDLSDLDIDPSMLPELSTNSNDDLDLSAFYLEEVHEKDLAEEEALLLAEVSKVERKQEELKQLAQNSNCNSSSTNSTAMPVNAEYSTDSKRSSSDEAQKSPSKSPPQAKRKVKVDWTPDLHRRFVQAVEQLGVDKAVPSRILELMGVTCLTRHNIASHLQKYRSHRKHLLAREAEAATWNQRRQLYGTSGSKEARPWSSSINGRGPLIQPRPAAIGYPSVAAAAPGHSPAPYRPALLHVWGHPSPAAAAAGDHSAFHMWHKRHCIPPATPSPWQSPRTSKDNWTHAAPGTPMFPQSLMRYPIPPFHGVPGSYIRPAYSGDLQAHIDATAKSYPSKEAVDAAISEVLSNPWTPLPIGLNPPSLDSVMAELQRQGVPQLPPASA